MVRGGGRRAGDLIGAAEAARLLGLSPQRIPQLAEEKKLPFRWIAGRRVYKRADVEAFKRARAKAGRQRPGRRSEGG
jgi:hypothetical protein